MEYEVYIKIKKGNAATLERLHREELPWGWFVSYCITGEISAATELLRHAFVSTVKMIAAEKQCPTASFRACFARELYRLSDEPVAATEMFSSFSPPRLTHPFDEFVAEILRADRKERKIYLLHQLGELGNGEFAELLGIPLYEAKEYLYALEKKIHPRDSIHAFTEYMHLANAFRSTNIRLFEHIEIPPLLLRTLEHDYQSIYGSVQKGKEPNRKEPHEMAQYGKNQAGKAQGNRRAAEKKKKIIIWSVVAAVLIAAVTVTVVLLVRKNKKGEVTRVTTYNVEEITFGNVSTTISGSGMLTPIAKTTLTVTDCQKEASADTGDDGTGTGVGGGVVPAPAVLGTVSEVKTSVGSTVAAGDVLAVVTLADESTVELVAPFDAVLLEFYLKKDAEVTAVDEVAMFMGTSDGYSMSISVDETNISTVAIGQEVDIKIDAVSGDYTGEVSDISYNGSTSGSVTAYQIKVAFAYVAGTYPGMSVSAEIVIEDSGDGLLVPVDAVYTSGDAKYVYLAPDGAALGTEYDEEELTLSNLTKIAVDTGMSDGTYIVITSDELEEGDLIVITKITSTLTGSESESNGGETGGFGGRGEMPSGGFPGGGSFPGSGSFDPSQFGGSFPGMN